MQAIFLLTGCRFDSKFITYSNGVFQNVENANLLFKEITVTDKSGTKILFSWQCDSISKPCSEVSLLNLYADSAITRSNDYFYVKVDAIDSTEALVKNYEFIFRDTNVVSRNTILLENAVY